MFNSNPAFSSTCTRKTLSVGAALSIGLALAACSNSSSPLLAPPSNIQTGQIPAKAPVASAAEQAQLKAVLKNCPTIAEPAKNIGVAAMLEQAKVAPDAPKPAQMSNAESECLAARVKAQLMATSSPQTAAAGPSAVVPSKGTDLTIDFDSETAPISPPRCSPSAAAPPAKF
jgi:hypothetical protein